MSQQKKQYVVTAASGKIGSRVAMQLLTAGHHVRAVGRDATRLTALVAAGATTAIGDVTDQQFVERAFANADAALLIAPPNGRARSMRGYFAEVGGNYANAARSQKLRSAVFISSLGAHDERNRGLVIPHTDVELLLNQVEGLDVLHLRCASFFENLFYFFEAMQRRGVVRSPIASDASLEVVGTSDIARVAAAQLLELSFAGKRSMELHGQRPITLREVAALLSTTLERPFAVEQSGRDEDIDRLLTAGLSRDFANLMNDTWELFSRHGLLRAEAPSKASTASTTVEQFVREQLAPAIVGAARPS